MHNPDDGEVPLWIPRRFFALPNVKPMMRYNLHIGILAGFGWYWLSSYPHHTGHRWGLEYTPLRFFHLLEQVGMDNASCTKNGNLMETTRVGDQRRQSRQHNCNGWRQLSDSSSVSHPIYICRGHAKYLHTRILKVSDELYVCYETFDVVSFVMHNDTAATNPHT